MEEHQIRRLSLSKQHRGYVVDEHVWSDIEFDKIILQKLHFEVSIKSCCLCKFIKPIMYPIMRERGVQGL